MEVRGAQGDGRVVRRRDSLGHYSAEVGNLLIPHQARSGQEYLDELQD